MYPIQKTYAIQKYVSETKNSRDTINIRNTKKTNFFFELVTVFPYFTENIFDFKKLKVIKLMIVEMIF